MEEYVIVGTVWYRYPASVWMDKEGYFYTTHEYDNNAYRFTSTIELIEHELRLVEIESVMIK